MHSLDPRTCLPHYRREFTGRAGAMAQEADIADLKQCAGSEVVISGWLAGRRSGGKIVFLLVRDGTGVCQCIVEPGDAVAFGCAETLSLESSVRVTGTVRADKRAPGGAEIAVSDIRVIHAADGDYPISRKAHGVDFLMAHRHLWLRSGTQTAILKIRHTLIRACRSFLDELGFTLVDTPILTPGAGEDAQSLFPVDYFGKKVFLAQTGQLYLESACMALRRVYCFGPTFRAEKSKTRRHLAEFWMIEPEVAFAELDDVIQLAEDMVRSVVSEVLKLHEHDLAHLGRDIASLTKVRKPFARISYSDAVDLLRSEELGGRLAQEMEQDRVRLEEQIAALKQLEARLAKTGNSREHDHIADNILSARETIAELEKDLASRPDHIQSARNFQWGNDLGGSDETIISGHFETPVFVTHYPREAKAFYMKILPEDRRLVCNMDLLAPEGYGEIIGGSQREEDAAVLLERIGESGLDPADYSWYLDLRRYGSVAHGGFGLGIERILSWICGLKHVRESIAFPRFAGRMDM